jgi:hypothetical protein
MIPELAGVYLVKAALIAVDEHDSRKADDIVRLQCELVANGVGNGPRFDL